MRCRTISWKRHRKAAVVVNPATRPANTARKADVVKGGIKTRVHATLDTCGPFELLQFPSDCANTVWCCFFFTCERTPPNRGRGARPCGRPCRRSGDTITFHFAVVWLAPPSRRALEFPTTSISNTRGASATDRSSTLCSPPTRSDRHCFLSLASDPETTSRLARTAALTVSQPAEFATALAMSLVLAFVVSVCPKTARATTGRGPITSSLWPYPSRALTAEHTHRAPLR